MLSMQRIMVSMENFAEYGELCWAYFFYRVRVIDPFDVVRYSLTPSNIEKWGGLSQNKFTVFVERSIAVREWGGGGWGSDNIV